jgi:hypothetical protein
MVNNRVKEKVSVEESQKHMDSFWDHIVIEALDSGMTTEEYLNFIKFIKEQTSKDKKLKMPIAHYVQMFNSDSSFHPQHS